MTLADEAQLCHRAGRASATACRRRHRRCGRNGRRRWLRRGRGVRRACRRRQGRRRLLLLRLRRMRLRRRSRRRRRFLSLRPLGRRRLLVLLLRLRRRLRQWLRRRLRRRLLLHLLVLLLRGRNLRVGGRRMLVGGVVGWRGRLLLLLLLCVVAAVAVRLAVLALRVVRRGRVVLRVADVSGDKPVIVVDGNVLLQVLVLVVVVVVVAWVAEGVRRNGCRVRRRVRRLVLLLLLLRDGQLASQLRALHREVCHLPLQVHHRGRRHVQAHVGAVRQVDRRVRRLRVERVQRAERHGNLVEEDGALQVRLRVDAAPGAGGPDLLPVAQQRLEVLDQRRLLRRRPLQLHHARPRLRVRQREALQVLQLTLDGRLLRTRRRQLLLPVGGAAHHAAAAAAAATTSRSPQRRRAAA
eukprot:Rhum_TRINITY_DN14193_c4_g1::Rhum_TRINITY_DN14193_c4_g1_i1::g.71769::m.71769